MKGSRTLKLMMAMVLLALVAEAHAQVTYRIEQIGPDPSPPDVYSYFVNDLNDKGEVIGGAYASTRFWSWLWRDGEFIRLPGLANAAEPPYIWANGMNDRTQIVGDASTEDPNATTPVLWQRDEVRVLQRLAAIPASPLDLNNLGMIVAQKSVNGSPVAFIQWGRYSLDLEPLPGSIYTAASHINERGMVIGNAVSDGYTRNRAVIWKYGKIQDLGVLPGGYSSHANGLNDRGDVAMDVTFIESSSARAAVWTEGHLVELPFSGYGDYVSVRATGINNAGTIVGAVLYRYGDTDALIWQNDTVYSLNDLIRADDPSRPYVRLVQAKMINNRGQIVAEGIDSRKPTLPLSFLLTPSGHL